jgi:proline iminopeptidase
MTWKKELISTKRGSFEVFIKGKGLPLCVTHLYSEFNESGDYFAESFTENHQVILVNLREAGGSPRADEHHQLSMIETVIDLEGVREGLGHKTWSFAGHSTGGMLGIMYGLYASESLDQLVLVGTAARDYSRSEKCIYHSQHPNYTYMQDLIASLKQPELTSKERSEFSKKRTLLSLYKSDDYNQYFSKNIQKKMAVSRMDFFAREVYLFDVTRKLHEIKVRTLILCGIHDVQCPYPFSEEIHEGVQDSHLVLFSMSNHYPFLEEKEKFLKELQIFFRNEK